MSDGRLLYRLKRRWRDGTTHVVFEALELVEKLAALVPPPRVHLVRYHGVLAPAAKARDRVVPEPGSQPCGHLPAAQAPKPVPPELSGATLPASAAPPPNEYFSMAASAARCDPAPEDRPAPLRPDPNAFRPDCDQARSRRLSWAELMQRVFAIDVLECPRCQGRMRILATTHPPQATGAILECLSLPARAPPTEAAQPEDDRDAPSQGFLDPCELG